MEQKIEIPKSKSFWKSKTVIFNALTVLMGLTEYLTPLNVVSAPVLLGINTVGNLILRLFFADQKLTVKTEKQLNQL